MKRFDRELRALLAFAFVNGIAESSLVPMLPSIRDDLGLSSVQVGLVLTTTTLAMLVAAIPVGYATSRFGTRGPLLFAAVLMPVGLVGQAFVGGLAALLAFRLLVGLSFGILWTIAPARASAEGRGAGGTGPLLAASGTGWLVGPVLGGVLADQIGWRTASLALAVVTVPLIPIVARSVSRGEIVRVESPRLRAAVGLLRHNRAIAGAALVSALLGVVAGVSGLLVPLSLAANGLSAGAIGIVFGASAAVWIASAAIVGRMQASFVNLHTVGIAVAVMAVAWLLPAVRLSTLALMGFLVVATATRSTINALNYAVGARASAGYPAPLAIGVLNLSWATTALVSPLLAGLADGSAGVRIAFAATGVAAACVAALLLLGRPRVRIEALSSS